MTLTCEERIARLDKFIREDRLLRGSWYDIDQYGKERVCLLVALSPEVKQNGNHISACPADVMPQWLALLTPIIDDCCSETNWPAIIRRYAALARRVSVLTSDDWQRLDFQCRAIAVREARAHTNNNAVLKIIDDILKLLDFAAKGNNVTGWYAAEYAAESAARAAAKYAARSAVRYAAESAAEYAARSAAKYAAASAAESAAYAAESAAEYAFKYAAKSAAKYVAWDRMIDKWMGAIEKMIVERENTTSK